MEILIQGATSIVTLIAVWFNGTKSIWGPRFSVLANAFWWTLVIYSDMWGLVPFQAAMTFMSYRMLFLWERDHHRASK